MEGSLDRFRRAFADPSLVVLEGFHALKHAVRFGADLVEVVSVEPLAPMIASLAPDIAVESRLVSAEEFEGLSPRKIATGVIAIARRPVFALDAQRRAPVVLLENPRHLGNVGAAVRVAAGAGASALLTTGPLDPWHPEAVRGAAGLQFALPVASVAGPPAGPLIALSPSGVPLEDARIPDDAVLAFGTERDGLSDELRARADATLRIPMREGVSSLNLATSVAIVLYRWRLAQR